ncbi:MAG: acyltransferase family protein [Geminicoccaceae bacterium]
MTRTLGRRQAGDRAIPYRPEIDGLRALAVLPVIFHHAGFDLFSGGYVGVDVFFVISGYLITGIIHREIAGGTFSLVGFYERRIRRILPALFLVSMACVPFASAWLMPDELRDFGQSLVAVNLFASNILFWLEIDYFAPDAALKPLLHTWSLAVEEQFYVVFPLLLLLLRRFREPALVAVLLLLSALSLGLAQWASGTFPVANFYLLPTRAWELGVGAIIAIAPGNGRLGDARAGQVASILGLGLVLYAVFAFDPMVPFPSFWTLVPVLGTGLLLAGAGPGNPVGRLLALPPLVGIGLISYSAYLWHQPLFVFARIRHISELEPWQYLWLVVLTLVLAWASWLLVERPFRQRGRVSARRIFVGAATVSVLLLAVGATIELAKGFPGRQLADGQTLAELQARVRSNDGLGHDCGQTLPLEAECRTSEAPEILVWGDSFAMHLTNGILADAPDAAIAQMTMAVCGPILGLAPIVDAYRGHWSADCLAFNESVIDWLGRHPSVRYVVLASPFAQYLDPANAYLVDGRVTGVDGQRSRPGLARDPRPAGDDGHPAGRLRPAAQ